MDIILDQIGLGSLLLLAMLLSALVGAERERSEKSAGLRTHILVGVGACLLASLSKHAFPDADSSRVAASAITGIGFLGAGVIFQKDDRVRQLTTAASIWITAAIGVAVGSGMWFLAIVATLVTWFTLVILHRFEQRFYDDKES